jgi:hypothetical protein
MQQEEEADFRDNIIGREICFELLLFHEFEGGERK